MIEKSLEKIVDEYKKRLNKLHNEWIDPLLSVLSEVSRNKKENKFDLSTNSFNILRDAITDFFGKDLYDLFINKINEDYQKEKKIDLDYIEKTVKYILANGKDCILARSKVLKEIDEELCNDIGDIRDHKIKKFYEEYYYEIYDILLRECDKGEKEKIKKLLNFNLSKIFYT